MAAEIVLLTGQFRDGLLPGTGPIRLGAGQKKIPKIFLEKTAGLGDMVSGNSRSLER